MIKKNKKTQSKKLLRCITEKVTTCSSMLFLPLMAMTPI
jgi:hypothetical protein